MSITGLLSDFSLPELFRFIDLGNKTGVLMLQSLPEFSLSPPSLYYIWVERGCIVAAANQVDEKGLLSLIADYQWLSDRVVSKLAQLCPHDQPFGLYLRHQGALSAEQLEHLFQVQLVQHFCALFQLKDAEFKFDQDVCLLLREMTGLSLRGRVLDILFKKLSLLQKLFAVRELQQEKSSLGCQAKIFGERLRITLDIAFFHSHKFSLFETNYTLTELAQFVDLYYRPYNLPKSRLAPAIG
ncbi:MAG TPA: hypothetical protein DDZ80_03140 [Cyanobacteria bacterium UBA8803]|nr:hypothetical protein [Cyanobacteria bacterium UBA9273]HBL57572.1 hypothetical protein [Cyanobacteria bacterium UBA8803]